MNLITILIASLSNIKQALVFKKYSLLFLSLILAAVQTFSYEIFKQFFQSRLNKEEVILMISLGLIYAVAVFVICLLDILSGLLSSWHNKVPFSGIRFIVGFFKVVVYEALVFFIFVFQIAAQLSDWGWIVTLLMGLMFFFGALIVLWEFRSVGENIERIFGKEMRMFYVLDKIIEAVELRFISKIRDSDMCGGVGDNKTPSDGT